MPDESQNNQDHQDNRNWLRRWLQRGRDQQASDMIAAQIGENARNVVVGKNVIQIGTLQIPMYLAVIIAAGVVISAASTLLFVLSPSGLADLFPKRLAGQYNIAVADFGEI